MINYIKSEFYRITHTPTFYIIVFILMGLGILYNTVNYAFSTQYATTSFSYSTLVVDPTIFLYTSLLITGFLYDNNIKNGNLKNTISSGIPRYKILFGKCVVAVFFETIALVLTLAAWIISAELLLEKSGPTELIDLMLEVPAIYLLAVSCTICTLILMELFSSNILSALIWCVIWIILPKLILTLGMRFEPLYKIALWIPANLFTIINSVHVNLSECITAWDTTQGFFKCILSGAVGIIFYLVIGTALVRKKDL